MTPLFSYFQIFLALAGAQGVAMCVCPAQTNLNRELKCHLSCLDLQISLDLQATLSILSHTSQAYNSYFIIHFMLPLCLSFYPTCADTD